MNHGTLKTSCAAVALCLLSILDSTAFAQGSLTPPGSPAPTMKTLEQTEPRSPIDGAHALGDSANQFIITNSGSYYLTGNLTGVSNMSGISIRADNVTVDLNGFALIGSPGSSNGIFVPAPQRNVRLRNGSAQNWNGSGILCVNASNSQFDHLRVSQNGVLGLPTAGIGLGCGPGCVIHDCSSESNANSGILTSDRCTVSGCAAVGNGDTGIATGSSCTVTASSSSLNSNVGIHTLAACTVISCTANANSFSGFGADTIGAIKDCTAYANGGYGISANSDMTIVNCTATANNAGGIRVNSRCTITGCTASGNTGGDGINLASDCLVSGNNASGNVNGIHVAAGGSLNRIDGNTANHNSQVGILWVNDVVMRNSAFLNTTANYSPAVGTGNTGPVNAASSSTSPWANF